ncbi:unnamed protein product [Parnassius apollo]|uniref:(apollo) hypothetical protein n=1 Tax=Parnassius apollo TaxID=110799 RepID=A0A8S3X4E5_PARAO|nr:unnamed protein product [Parnassius apollo]
MSRTTRKKLKDDDIENMLMRLEAGEISEDDAESDEDDLDFYPSRKDLQAVLEDKEVSDEEEVPETEECPDPPLVHEEIYQQASTSRSNVFPQINTRNLIWKKRSLEYKEESIAFLGSTELGPELMKLETPLQFFSQYFSEDLLKKIVEETNKYSTQTNIDRPVQISLTELRKYLGILIFIGGDPSVSAATSEVDIQLEDVSRTLPDQTDQDFSQSDFTVQTSPSLSMCGEQLEKTKPEYEGSKF